MSDPGYADFEFERRFWVRRFPATLRDAPALIVQSYYLADGGYGLRIRATAPGLDAGLGPDADAITVLDEHADEFSLCTMTAKGPMVGGTRYEAERELDPGIGMEMIRRGGSHVVKTRYSTWLGADGWVVDVFGGTNRPLVIAECERSGPVVDLAIPDFCVTEVTDDARFSNDALARTPYCGWASAYERELAAVGPRFDLEFGLNARLSTE